MQSAHKASVLNRLKTVRGHLDGVIRMVEAEEYCVDLMKQVSALQASLERANRLILVNHLETCFSDAVNEGRGSEVIDELMQALKFNSAPTGPDALLGLAAESVGASDAAA
jgi:CsoR family transcriptional regulator, copper-sensing transcriptional repressor